MAATGEPVTWPALTERWSLVEYAFHAQLGIDLEDVWRRKSWRWFSARVSGLLSDPESLLARFFAPDPDQPVAPDKPEARDE